MQERDGGGGGTAGMGGAVVWWEAEGEAWKAGEGHCQGRGMARRKSKNKKK